MSTQRTEYFNFRHVLQDLGVPLVKQRNWRAGVMLFNLAAKNGIDPGRIPTAKTDTAAKVPAKHCINHYPMEFYGVARAYFLERFEDERRQMGLFDP